jgi:hypothetical protein
VLHKVLGGKFCAQMVSYPELGGHVLMPDFDRAQWQHHAVTNQQVPRRREGFPRMDRCVLCDNVATRWWGLEVAKLWKVPLNVN